eukprot:14593189-Alexandrium_andersonii.AAC.1
MARSQVKQLRVFRSLERPPRSTARRTARAKNGLVKPINASQSTHNPVDAQGDRCAHQTLTSSLQPSD